MIIITSGFFITMLIQGVFTSTLSSIIDHHHGQHITLFGMVVSITFLSGLIQAVRWSWEPYLGKRIGAWSDGAKGRLPLYIRSLLFTALTFGLISSKMPPLV